ncbi:MAG: hypothetical protein HN731_00650 [Rhodospirillaceae bacterium]|nr:hypothetical protein [Rhodospirillaceae bacterium]
MNFVENDYIERRLSENRRVIQNRRSGYDRRVTAKQLGANLRTGADRRNNDRRAEDRRKHCMHCGMTYKDRPGGETVCVCRINALRGANDIL